METISSAGSPTRTTTSSFDKGQNGKLRPISAAVSRIRRRTASSAASISFALYSRPPLSPARAERSEPAPSEYCFSASGTTCSTVMSAWCRTPMPQA